MTVITNLEPINPTILNKSLLIVGKSGTGKGVLLKNLILASLSANKKVGILCCETDINEFARLHEDYEAMVIYNIKDEESDKFGSQYLKAFVESVDVVIVDEALTTIGGGEELHTFLDLCMGKIKIVTYQSLDSISKSQTFLESISSRFDKTVFFRSQDSFSTAFLLGKEVAATVDNLTLGYAIVSEN